MREISPLDRCKECGTATTVLVYDHGLDDNGEQYRAIYRDNVPHSRNECAYMVALIRETWPTLW